MKLINIISEQTSGLASDSRILAATLSQLNFEIKVRKVGLGRLNGLVNRIVPQAYWMIFQNKMPSINIFCEEIFETWLNTAKTNVLIPNQEWCRPATVDLLPQMNRIFCKTRYAETIFKDMGCNTTYIGFTSEDHCDKSIKKNYSKFLHIAGKSLQKGTVPIVRTWSRHPEWPNLTIITHNPALISEYIAPNITIESQVSTERLLFLQNECGLHLCLSEAEGFGHVINEARACGAVVVTTDAPPMNELIKPEYGFLVEYARSSPQSLGANYYVDEEALAYTINLIVNVDIELLIRMGQLARVAYINGATDFQRRLIEDISHYN